jgi:DNA polymerase-3 subunit beta
MPQKALRELLLLVQYAMAQQDIRYYLNGLLLLLDGGQIKVIATDGHRLSFSARPLGQQLDKREVIIPRKAVLELGRLLADVDESVELEIFASLVRFSFGDTVLTTKIIDGKFPDYTRVVPTNYQKRFSVKRQQLLQSLQRAAILANEKFRGVRWMVAPNMLRISCTNNEQEEAQEEMEIAYGGDALDIGFNIMYLLDVLNNVQSEDVECAFGDANSSMLVTVPDNREFRYVVMPMRI